MAGGKFTEIGKYRLYFDEEYYLAYSGKRRKLSKKDEIEYQSIIALPFGDYQRDLLHKLPRNKNPELIPLSGRRVLEYIRDLNFVPMFDLYFKDTRTITLTDEFAYEYILNREYKGIKVDAI
jgi:hypothetical protein